MRGESVSSNERASSYAIREKENSQDLYYYYDISRYYNAKVRKSPHVVGHYAAGARLIGLTEKQMAQHLATLNQSGDENSDSPYAQPVCLFNSPPASSEKDSRKGKIRLRIINKKLKDPNDTEERSADGEKVQV